MSGRMYCGGHGETLPCGTCAANLARATKRRFVDAPNEERCEWTITLRDHSQAQCGRRHVDGHHCTQHAKRSTS